MAEAAQRPEAPHAFVGGPAWESRPERPPVIDAAALRALAAEVEANGVNPCVNRTLITMELAKVCGYAPPDDIIPWRVGRDFGCLELFSVAREGSTPSEQNMGYSMTNHSDMMKDEPRVRAYADAIGRVGYGRRAVDIGSGPHCLLARLILNAGASRVDAIEQNDEFVTHAISCLEAEAADDATHSAVAALRKVSGAAGLATMFDVDVASADPPAKRQKTEGTGPAADEDEAAAAEVGKMRCDVGLRMKGLGAMMGGASSSSDAEYDDDGDESESDGEGNGDAPEGAAEGQEEEEGEEEEEPEEGTSSLRLYHGLSSVCGGLRGGYNLVVHEILGHVSSSEGAVGALVRAPTLLAACAAFSLTRVRCEQADLHHRGLIEEGAVCIPRASGTMLTPTAPLTLSTLETLTHRHTNNDDHAIHGATKYHCNRFPDNRRLAPAQPMEWHEFGSLATLGPEQSTVLSFVLPEGGQCDGFHLSLRVAIDDTTTIESDRQETTWSSVYVRLRGGGLPGPEAITVPPGYAPQPCPFHSAEQPTQNNVSVRSGTIVATCRSQYYGHGTDAPSYSVAMKMVPGPADEAEVEIGEFSWTGT